MMEVMSATQSVCPVCLKVVSARCVAEGEKIYIEKSCPQHGPYRTLVWEGKKFYVDWTINNKPGSKLFQSPQTSISRGCPYDCGLCPEHQRDSCTVVVEVTNRCNIKCPICFASSDGSPLPVYEPDLETIGHIYEKLVRAAGGDVPVQLSGGEPTTRNDLPEIIAMGKEYGFPHLQVNTNGVRLGQDRAYLQRLKDAGLNAVYLQWDGVDDEVYQQIRGANLLEIKLRALENCAQLGIGVILVPTLVPGINTHQIGAIIQFAKSRMPIVKGVHFQPVSYFGRYPSAPKDDDRITIPRLFELIEQQTDGEVRKANFAPMKGCEHPTCSFSGFFVLGEDGKLLSTTTFKPIEDSSCYDSGPTPSQRARKYVASRWQYHEPAQEDSCSCKCGTGSWIEFYKRASSQSLCISGMAFQDAWNVDIERLKRCCIHVFTEGGRLIPLCAYYLTSTDGERLYNNLQYL